MVEHAPIKCIKTKQPARYSFRNWSRQFQCEVCGRTCWKSLNFLGQNSIICDGVKFKTVKKVVTP